jgi:steroid 5-alpha reductase family enzyme
MGFFEIYFWGLLIVISFFLIIWAVSLRLKNASIVDIFWGIGFVLLNAFYFVETGDFTTRKMIILVLVTLWGLRLSIHIFLRNRGKGEDFRYQNFRKHYGEKRYWWVSCFQVFLLQGVLVWLISVPLLAVHYYSAGNELEILDYLSIFIWLIGFTYEAGGDFQLAKFKSNPANKGKVLQTGFWKYTRHPNYFGDAAVWWSYGLFSIASGSYLPLLGPIIMTYLIVKVSGVSLLEKSLKNSKPQYAEYENRTSAFLPWFPKKTAYEDI